MREDSDNAGCAFRSGSVDGGDAAFRHRAPHDGALHQLDLEVVVPAPRPTALTIDYGPSDDDSFLGSKNRGFLG